MGKAYSSLGNMRSLLTDDTEFCVECGSPAVHCHHIYEGPDKPWSEEFNLMIPLCVRCHAKIHVNQLMNDSYKRLGQQAFEKSFKNLKFTDYFRRSYL